MPNTKSAKKRLRQNEKRRLRNRSQKSYLKTIAKKVKDAAGKNEAVELLKQAYKAYDKAASKGIIHKNNAARHKSRLTQFVKDKFADAVTPPPAAETPPPAEETPPPASAETEATP
jgi:small subunit ribosomal protein S20